MTMMTLDQAAPGVLADAGGSVAVAAAALVVVLTIVIVFVMVLRSNGSASRTASGLGFDAQQGPLGQPQRNPDAGPWSRPLSQQQQQQMGGFGQQAGPSQG